MKQKIFRQPAIGSHTDEVNCGAAFTMRLLNTLYIFKMKAQGNIKLENCIYFAARRIRGKD